MKRFLVGTSALAVLLAACEPDTTGTRCEPRTLSVSATRGDTVTLNTGLRYLQLQQGSSAAVEYCDVVQVSYTGLLTDGTQFDAGTIGPFPIGYSAVIPGFEQGIVGMQIGGRRRLIVPPTLGYGSNPPAGSGIPVGATLIFDVELLAFQDR